MSDKPPPQGDDVSDKNDACPPETDPWEKALKIIELENNLINHRLTALLTLHGFLLGGLIFGSNGVASAANEQYQLLILILLTLVSIIGVVSPWFISPGMRAALRQVLAAAAWLKNVRTDPKFHKKHPDPPIIGKIAASWLFWLWPFDEDESYSGDDLEVETPYVRGRLGSHLIPRLLSVTWGVFLVVVIVFLVRRIDAEFFNPNKQTTTTIKFTEKDSGSSVKITFEGDASKLPEFEHRMKGFGTPATPPAKQAEPGAAPDPALKAGPGR